MLSAELEVAYQRARTLNLDAKRSQEIVTNFIRRQKETENNFTPDQKRGLSRLRAAAAVSEDQARMAAETIEFIRSRLTTQQGKQSQQLPIKERGQITSKQNSHDFYG